MNNKEKKILFIVASVDNEYGMNTFIYSQGESIKAIDIKVDYCVLKGKSWWKYVKGYFIIKKFLKLNKYDIVHAHYSYCGFIAVLCRIKPLVVSLMGSDLLYGDDQSGFINNYVNNFINKIIVKYSNAIICKSTQMKDYFIEKYKRQWNVFVIPNGVNIQKFKPVDKESAREQLNLELNKKYILFGARTDSIRKNYKLASESFETLKENCGGGKIELLNIYGVSQDILVRYLSACDVLLFTSLVEGSPNLIKEAMACNIPIVSVNVGDVAERLGGVRNSYITSSNPKEIAQRLKLVLDSHERSDGREKIEKELNEKIIAKKLMRIYQTI